MLATVRYILFCFLIALFKNSFVTWLKAKFPYFHVMIISVLLVVILVLSFNVSALVRRGAAGNGDSNNGATENSDSSGGTRFVSSSKKIGSDREQ